MKIVNFAENPFDPSSWERHEVEDVRAFLVTRFASFPSTARIYHGEVIESCDVTPSDKAGVDRLGSLPGPFFVIVYPGDGVTIAIAVIAVAAAAALAFLLRPQIPNLGKTTPGSSNNDLSDRQNQARVHGRIPDILGTVRSTPDLIAPPYKVFESNREVEYCYMSVGRGAYEISDVRDDTTLIENIAAASVAVYGPNTAPGSGSPQVTIPADKVITEPLRNVKRFTSVNGQELLAPNESLKCSVRFVSPNRVELHPDEQVDFTEHYNPGGTVTIDASPQANFVPDYNFDGTYTISGVEERVLYLTSPAAVNAWWDTIFDETGGAGTVSAYTIGLLSNANSKWTGPFDLDVDAQTEIWANVVAPSGLYKVNGSGVQSALDVGFSLMALPIDASGNEIGRPSEPIELLAWFAAHAHPGVITGSSVDRKQRAVTFKVVLPGPGRYRVSMCRTLNKDYIWIGQQQDEIQWRDVYSVSPVSVPHFGDVTTIQSRMEANKNSLAVKSRKLNLLVTRKIKCYGVEPVGSDGFSTTLLPTNDAADIFCHVSRDPRIGNRALDELNIAGIYAARDANVEYFGTSAASEFCATLDKDNLSYEETAAMVAGVMFCTAYRRGSEINLSFERETQDSTLLFNHRNKIPGTEVRTFAFGNPDGNDGVQLEYVDPDDDSVRTLYLPADRSSLNPKKVETIGIRNPLQAYFHANRALNRLRYQSVATEFEATQEADVLVLKDRILVADNTRPETQDGDVLLPNGLELHLSQPVKFVEGKTYSIFLQHIDGTVESIGVTPGTDECSVVLAHAPKASLSVDEKMYARATYQVVEANNPRERAFLVTEKEPQTGFTSTVRAVNYDDRYYAADQDFVRGVVDEDGVTTGAAGLWGPSGYASEAELAAVIEALSTLVNSELP